MTILSIFKKSSSTKSSEPSSQPPPYSVVDTHPTSSSSTPRSSFSQDSAYNAQRHQNVREAKAKTFKPSAMCVAMSRV